MTRRERLERKVERRREWAVSRKADADRRIATARTMASGIPFGQPILVGHHSEKRDRNYRGRIESNFEKGFESMNMAAHHESKAAGLAAALDSTIFSDDTDAIGALEARIAEREAELAKMKTINKLYRKGDAAGLEAMGLNLDALKAQITKLHSWDNTPYPGYSLTNLGANIRRDKKRIGEIKARTAKAEKAEAAPGGVLIETSKSTFSDREYARVTFAEKPDRSVLNDLKAAGFSWGAGGWSGYLDNLPASVRALTETGAEV